MKKGFILLEILIATVVSSLLATGLLAMIAQVNELQQTIISIASQYGRVAIFQQQMERDLMGAFVPTQFEMVPTQTGKPQESKKPLEMIFEGKSKGKGGRLDFLTFITSNPLEIFFGIKDIKLKPRIARVVYRLIPDVRRKNAYQLLRQEGTSKLPFDQYKEDAEGEFRAFTMIDGIQDLSVQFVQIEELEDKESKKISYRYKKSAHWQSIESKDEEKKEQKPYPQIPNWVQFTLSLWDRNYEKDRSFTFTVPIGVKMGEYTRPKEEKSKESDEKKSTVQPAGKP